MVGGNPPSPSMYSLTASDRSFPMRLPSFFTLDDVRVLSEVVVERVQQAPMPSVSQVVINFLSSFSRPGDFPL
ncbi:MAG: hypothetical protein CM15mP128_0070 [Methanobacteriota archaeon]|nr:MAG: hypothetical protein CM15mP128_0070 [Euryarchaeota archaeon]